LFHLLVLALIGSALQLGVTRAQAQAAAATRFEGTLNVVWGDPRPGRSQTGETRFNLTLPDGTTHPLQLDESQRNAAVTLFGQRVVVQGRMASAARAGGQSPIAVESIEADPALRAPAPQAAVIGTRKVLFILLKFKGDAQMPHPVSFYTTQLTNPLTPPAGSKSPATINGFYDKTSWAKLKWVASVAGVGGLKATGWLTLPKTKSQYAPCGWSGACADLTAIQQDALAMLAKPGANHVDVTGFDNINFVLNNDLDCCAWGGGFTYMGKSYGATWEPPWGQEVGTYVHEFGHSIGLPHSGWRYYAYDSHHDEMSRGNPAAVVICGTYKSANDGGATDNIYCTKPGGGYITAHKNYLGWIPAKNKTTLNTKTTKTYVIEANALPLGTRLKMVIVCLAGQPCTGAAARFLTIEAKMKVADYEKGLPTEGIVIHDIKMNRAPIGGKCFFNNQSGWAVPIDATPGDFNSSTCSPQDTAGSGLMNMPFVVGKTYNSPLLGVKVQVKSKTATTMTVVVTRTK
jgi:hypothetical protein